MPVLKKTPGKLTIGEAIERLKKNPDDPDPELQRFKKSMETFYANFAPKIIEIHQYSKAAIEAIQPTIQLYSAAVSAIKPPPPYIFESIRRVSEDMQRLTEPMRILADTIAKLQAPLIYPVLPRVDNQTPVIEKVPHDTHAPIKSYQEELLEEQNDLLRQVVNRLQKEEPKIKGKPFFFDEESRTFIVKEVRWRALNLHTERGKESMSIFFMTLLELLKINGVIHEHVLRVPIVIKDLLERLKSKGIEQPTKEWIKSTKSNLINKKILPAKLDNVIIIEEYDATIDGFYFGIKLPIEELDS